MILSPLPLPSTPLSHSALPAHAPRARSQVQRERDDRQVRDHGRSARPRRVRAGAPRRPFPASSHSHILSPSFHPPNASAALRRRTLTASTSLPPQVRLFLSPYDLTPTYRNINNKFSVKYFLNLVLVDEEDRRYFKQQEITMHRQDLV